MKIKLFFPVLFFPALAFSQGSQPLRVVGAAGTVVSSGGYTLGFTVGEVATQTFVNNATLRQGFWQGYEVTVPVIEAGGTQAEITVFPNPFDGGLFVETEGNLTQPFDMLLFDLDGRLLLKQRIHPPGAAELEGARSLPSGIYLLSIRDEEGTLLGSAKVVKIR